MKMDKKMDKHHLPMCRTKCASSERPLASSSRYQGEAKCLGMFGRLGDGEVPPMTFIYAYDNSVSATVLGIFIVLGVGCFWAFSEFVTNVFTALFLPKRRARLEARRLEQQAIG